MMATLLRNAARLGALVVLGVVPLRGETTLTVALLPARHEVLAADDPEAGAALSAELLGRAGLVEGVDWVERGELERVLEEQGLAAVGIVDPARAVQVGRLAGAAVLVQPRVVWTGETTAVVRLEAVDARTSDLLAARDVPADSLAVRNLLRRPSDAEFDAVVPALRTLVADAAAVLRGRAGRPLVAPLFLAPREDAPALSAAQAAFFGELRRAAGDRCGVLRLDRSDDALGETELALAGLTDAASGSWTSIATTYVWGTVEPAGDAPTVAAQPVRVVLDVWDGQGDPRRLERATTLGELAGALRGLAEEVVRWTEAVPAGRPVDHAARLRLAGVLTARAEAVRAQRAEAARLRAFAQFLAPEDREAAWAYLRFLRVRALQPREGVNGVLGANLRAIGLVPLVGWRADGPDPERWMQAIEATLGENSNPLAAWAEAGSTVPGRARVPTHVSSRAWLGEVDRALAWARRQPEAGADRLWARGRDLFTAILLDEPAADTRARFARIAAVWPLYADFLRRNPGGDVSTVTIEQFRAVAGRTPFAVLGRKWAYGMEDAAAAAARPGAAEAPVAAQRGVPEGFAPITVIATRPTAAAVEAPAVATGTQPAFEVVHRLGTALLPGRDAASARLAAVGEGLVFSVGVGNGDTSASLCQAVLRTEPERAQVIPWSRQRPEPGDPLEHAGLRVLGRGPNGVVVAAFTGTDITHFATVDPSTPRLARARLARPPEATRIDDAHVAGGWLYAVGAVGREARVWLADLRTSTWSVVPERDGSAAWQGIGMLWFTPDGLFRSTRGELVFWDRAAGRWSGDLRRERVTGRLDIASTRVWRGGLLAVVDAYAVWVRPVDGRIEVEQLPAEPGRRWLGTPSFDIEETGDPGRSRVVVRERAGTLVREVDLPGAVLAWDADDERLVALLDGPGGVLLARLDLRTGAALPEAPREVALVMPGGNAERSARRLTFAPPSPWTCAVRGEQGIWAGTERDGLWLVSPDGRAGRPVDIPWPVRRVVAVGVEGPAVYVLGEERGARMLAWRRPGEPTWSTVEFGEASARVTADSATLAVHAGRVFLDTHAPAVWDTAARAWVALGGPGGGPVEQAAAAPGGFVWTRGAQLVRGDAAGVAEVVARLAAGTVRLRVEGDEVRILSAGSLAARLDRFSLAGRRFAEAVPVEAGSGLAGGERDVWAGDLLASAWGGSVPGAAGGAASPPSRETERLLRAALQGDGDAVVAAVRAGADVQARLPDRRSALDLVVERGEFAAAWALLEAGYDPTAGLPRDRPSSGWTIDAAFARGAFDLGFALLERGGVPDLGREGVPPPDAWGPMASMVRARDAASVRRFLELATRLEPLRERMRPAEAALAAVWMDEPELLALVVDGVPRQETPLWSVARFGGETSVLHEAAALGRVRCVDVLRARGAVPNERDRRARLPVDLAADDATRRALRGDAGGEDAWRALAVRGAAGLREALARGVAPGARGDDGLSLLGFAVQSGDVESVRVLVAAGVDPGRELEQGVPQIAAAAYLGHVEVVRELLARGVPLDATPVSVPVLQAFRQPDVAIVQAFLEAGADPAVVDARGHGALAYAAVADAPDVVRLAWEVTPVEARLAAWRIALDTAARLGRVRALRTLLDVREADRDAVYLASSWDPEAWEIVADAVRAAGGPLARDVEFWGSGMRRDVARARTEGEIEAHVAAGGTVSFVAGVTPLAGAVARGDAGMVEVMVRRGVRPWVVGRSPYHILEVAVAPEQLVGGVEGARGRVVVDVEAAKLVRRLVQAGAGVRTLDAAAQMRLVQTCVRKGLTETLAALVEAGVDPALVRRVQERRAVRDS